MVSIITVNYNETPTTFALLDSIRAQGFRDVEVIVVDNASRDNPAEDFQNLYPEDKFIRSEQNLGFAGGNNLALPEAMGEFLFFVNNDAEIEPGCIELLLQFFENHPNAGIVSPLICYFPDIYPPDDATSKPATIQYAGMTKVSPFTGRNRTIGKRELDAGQYTMPGISAFAHGAAMMVPRKVLEQVGPMWEGFFLYYEELDWCERIRQAGFEVWVEPRARIWHKESLTLNKLGTTKTYYLTRNRILFMRRNFGGWRLAVFYVFFLLVTLPKNIVLNILKLDFKTLKVFLSASIDGFRSMINPPKL